MVHRPTLKLNYLQRMLIVPNHKASLLVNNKQRYVMQLPSRSVDFTPPDLLVYSAGENSIRVNSYFLTPGNSKIHMHVLNLLVCMFLGQHAKKTLPENPTA